jgi:hypothetical protein
MKIRKNFWIIITIIFIKFTITQSKCGSFVPQDSNSCFMYSTNTTYCCSLSTFSNKFYSNICYPISMTDYLPLNNKINLGGYEYDINCGTFIGTTCGYVSTPVSYKDCSQFSKNTNSCCFMKYQGDTSCVWLGTGDTGQVEYNGLVLICEADFLKISLILLFALLFLLF